jgi:hypothetical protein
MSALHLVWFMLLDQPLQSLTIIATISIASSFSFTQLLETFSV